MTRDAAILDALNKVPAGLTVVELSILLNRTGGDITKGISILKKTHNIISKVQIQDYNRRKTVKYTLVAA